MIGATVAGLVAILVALVDQGPWTALLMLGGVILVQQIEGHVLQPFLMGRFVSLHPLGVIVAIGCGVLVAGIAGALVAVPLAAAGNAVAQHLSSYTDVGDDDPDEALEDDIGPPPNEGDEVHDDGPLAGPDAPDDDGSGRGMTEQCFLADIVAAREMLEGLTVTTPMEESRWLSALVGGRVSLKCENLQRTGSFKSRGAYVRISRLSAEERAKGVVAASAGNHAQGVALAASTLGINVHRLHARGGADPQGEGDPRLRRRRRLPRPLPRGLARAGPAVRRRDRRGADPPLRPRRHRRGAGHARARGPRAGAGRTHRAGAHRRWRAARRGGDRGQGAAPRRTRGGGAGGGRRGLPGLARSRASPCRWSR